MTVKRQVLHDLGWSDELIDAFLINDGEAATPVDPADSPELHLVESSDVAADFRESALSSGENIQFKAN